MPDVTITPSEDGPYLVSGEVRLTDVDGREIPHPDLLDANKIADPDHDWGYTSRGTIQAPQVPAPRGKVLGGSSAVNATVALRARAADFAKWEAHGAEGWSFDDVLPVFKLLENTP